MFLSDSAIQFVLDRGSLSITSSEPIERRIQPASVELHLGNEFKTFDVGRKYIDPLEEQAMQTLRVEQDADQPWFILEPKQFALAHTIETVGVDATLAAQVDGKSSLARLGLQVHMTSGFVDPGFKGQLTFELFNAAPKPIILRPGMVIAQLFIIPLWGPVERPYGSPGIDSRYQGQTGATASRYEYGREAGISPEGVEALKGGMLSTSGQESSLQSEMLRSVREQMMAAPLIFREDAVEALRCCSNEDDQGKHFDRCLAQDDGQVRLPSVANGPNHSIKIVPGFAELKARRAKLIDESDSDL